MIHNGVELTDVYLILGLVIGAGWGFVAGAIFSHWWDWAKRLTGGDRAIDKVQPIGRNSG
jgi:hypothetical protein